MMSWIITVAIAVIGLIGVMMIPSKKRIEEDDNIETYEGTGKSVVYLLGLVVVGAAGYLLLQYFVFKTDETEDLWFKIDMALFMALGVGIIAYNAYSVKMISELEFVDDGEIGVQVVEAEAVEPPKTAVTKKKTVKKKVVKKKIEEGPRAECPVCKKEFVLGSPSCPGCGAEFDYDDEGHVFDCPVCKKENVVGTKACTGCGAEFDYD